MGFTGLLETTGVIGFLALIVFTTKDYWLRDFLSGILVIGGNQREGMWSRFLKREPRNHIGD